MSLYYETATLLTNPSGVGGSFKARIFKAKELKSKPGQIYALVAESSKWSIVLKGVVEKCGVLGAEKKVCLLLIEKRINADGCTSSRPCSLFSLRTIFY